MVQSFERYHAYYIPKFPLFSESTSFRYRACWDALCKRMCISTPPCAETSDRRRFMRRIPQLHYRPSSTSIFKRLLNNKVLHIFPHISLPQNTFLLNLLSADERLMDTQNSFSWLLYQLEYMQETDLICEWRQAVRRK